MNNEYYGRKKIDQSLRINPEFEFKRIQSENDTCFLERDWVLCELLFSNGVTDDHYIEIDELLKFAGGRIETLSNTLNSYEEKINELINNKDGKCSIKDEIIAQLKEKIDALYADNQHMKNSAEYNKIDRLLYHIDKLERDNSRLIEVAKNCQDSYKKLLESTRDNPSTKLIGLYLRQKETINTLNERIKELEDKTKGE